MGRLMFEDTAVKAWCWRDDGLSSCVHVDGVFTEFTEALSCGLCVVETGDDSVLV